MKLHTVGLKGAAITAAALAMLAAGGAPALAHVKVAADKPQAGATAVTVTFTAGAESKTAGISGLRTFLPAGVAPADVTYVSGPPGWALKPQPDGFTVEGPPLAPGEDAAYAVRLAKLPVGVTQLPLRTLQRYADGQIEKWTDTTKSVEKEEPNAAPALALAAAGAAAPAAGQVPAASQQPLGSVLSQYPKIVWIAGGGALALAVIVILWVRSRLV